MRRLVRTPRKGRELQAARALLGWTQAELARAAGLHTKSVSYWERRTEQRIGGHAVHLMAEALEAHGLVLIDGCVILVKPSAPALSRTDNFATP
ncbi:MAG: helix-turn-helix transcriptional regulator [Pseudomonadota bacterium]